MPVTEPAGITLSGEEIFPGRRMEMGSVAIPEKDMIAYAELCDPMPFHVDREYASTTVFGGIIASGSQLFTEFHKRFYIPRFGFTVVAGLSIDHWRFLQPHYPDQEISAVLEVLGVEPKPEKGVAIIHWKYTFNDIQGQPVQSAEFRVMHRTDVSDQNGKTL